MLLPVISLNIMSNIPYEYKYLKLKEMGMNDQWAFLYACKIGCHYNIAV